MLDGIQPSSNGSKQPLMDGTFSLYKILNFKSEDEIYIRITQMSVLYFPQTMSSLCLVQLSLISEETLTNPNNLAECQNTPATAYVRGSFCFEYWVPLTVRVTQARVRPK